MTMAASQGAIRHAGLRVSAEEEGSTAAGAAGASMEAEGDRGDPDFKNVARTLRTGNGENRYAANDREWR
jgi:hypothetical protein